MSTSNIEYLIDRICSGEVALECNKKTYFYKHPSPKRKYKANLKYLEVLQNTDDVLSSSEALSIGGEWNDKLQAEVDIHIPKVLEGLKLDIYLCYREARKSYIPDFLAKIEKVKDRLFDLLSIKHRYDDFTAEGLAQKEKSIYLLRKCIPNLDTSPELLLPELYASTISDESIREIARSGEWSTKWAAMKKGCRVFSKNITDEQERLIRWTSLYENILEGQEAPSDEVINDDNAFDGYLIWRKKEADRERGIEQVDKMLGKHAGASEVFIPARDIEHAREINALNTPEAIQIKKDRFAMIEKMGTCREADFKDRQLDIALAKNRM